jgi:outer membrane PBP1 activator LpoA protein
MIKFRFLTSLAISLFAGAHSSAFAQKPDKTPTPSISTAPQSTSPVNAAQYLLQASALLYEQKNFSAANNILNTIDASSLTPDLKQNYTLQQATLALHNKDIAKATIWLNEPTLTQINSSDVKKQVVLHELRAKVFLSKTQFFDAAKEYLQLLSITEKNDQQPYIDALWDSLSKTDTVTLNDVKNNTPTSSDLYNWTELVLITKDDSIGKEDQHTAIKKWFLIHPHHPLPSPLK